MESIWPINLCPLLDQFASLGLLMGAPLDRVQVVDKVALVLRQEVTVSNEDLFLLGFQVVSVEGPVDQSINILKLVLVRDFLLRVDFILSPQEIESLFQRIKPASFEIGVINLEAIIEVSLGVGEQNFVLDLLMAVAKLVLVQDHVGKFREFDLQEGGRDQTIGVVEFYV